MANEMLAKLQKLQATEAAIQKKVDDFAKELGYDVLFDDDPEGLEVIKDSWKLQLRLGCEKITCRCDGYNPETGEIIVLKTSPNKANRAGCNEQLDLYNTILENM